MFRKGFSTPVDSRLLTALSEIVSSSVLLTSPIGDVAPAGPLLPCLLFARVAEDVGASSCLRNPCIRRETTGYRRRDGETLAATDFISNIS